MCAASVALIAFAVLRGRWREIQLHGYSRGRRQYWFGGGCMLAVLGALIQWYRNIERPRQLARAKRAEGEAKGNAILSLVLSEWTAD